MKFDVSIQTVCVEFTCLTFFKSSHDLYSGNGKHFMVWTLSFFYDASHQNPGMYSRMIFKMFMLTDPLSWQPSTRIIPTYSAHHHLQSPLKCTVKWRRGGSSSKLNPTQIQTKALQIKDQMLRIHTHTSFLLFLENSVMISR